MIDYRPTYPVSKEQSPVRETIAAFPLVKITTRDRIRKDLGDITSLAESIDKTTLLHPLVVDPDFRLIAGERRLAALRRLGWDRAPVIVTDELDTALGRILAERDENTERKALTPEEVVRAGEMLAKLEQPKAKERMSEGGKGRSRRVTHASEKGRVDKKVAEALGTSEPTYRRMKKVVEVAGDPDQPEDMRQVAQEALAEMNETGKVLPAYNKVASLVGLKAHKGGSAPQKETPPSSPSSNGSKPPSRQGRRAWKGKPAEEVMDQLVATLQGAVSALEATDLAPILQSDKTQHWNNEIAAAIRYLSKVRKKLATTTQENNL